MHILVHLCTPAEQTALCEMLQTWLTFSCVSMQVVTQAPPDGPEPTILFWDLDGPAPPVLRRPDCALILCARDPQQAIGSYCFHPAGFLTKPITPDDLWAVMGRCAALWASALRRLEIPRGRERFPLPIYNLVWAEGGRRGCLLHTVHEAVTTREPLYRLEEALPPAVFLRCQRSFLVNITHVRQIAGSRLVLRDGTALPLGRQTRASVVAAYRRYHLLRYGQEPRPHAKPREEAPHCLTLPSPSATTWNRSRSPWPD